MRIISIFSKLFKTVGLWLYALICLNYDGKTGKKCRISEFCIFDKKKMSHF